MTTIYILPLRSKEMPLFEQIQTAGQVVQLPAARDMHLDDVVLLHLGNWHLSQESGIYAYGSVIYGPYILEGHPDHLCNNKNTVDVRVDRIEHDHPIITHEQCKRFTGRYRSIHAICDGFNDSIKALLNIDYSSKPQKSKLGNKLNSYPKTIEKRTLLGIELQKKQTKS